MHAEGRARFSSAAALVVAGSLSLSLLLLSTTAANAQDGAAPPSPVPAAPPDAAPAPETKKPAPDSAPAGKPTDKDGSQAEKNDPQADKNPPPADKSAPPADKNPAQAEKSAPQAEKNVPQAEKNAPQAEKNAPQAVKAAAKPAEAPKPKPTPVAPPSPPAKQPPAPAPAPAAAPVVEVDQKTLQLERDVKAALAKSPPDARRLEQSCGGWHPKKVFDERPVLAGLIPLCLGRAAMVQGNADLARKKLTEALSAVRDLPVDTASLELRAEVLFRRAEVEEEQLEAFQRCGTGLGLRRLASWEARQLAQRLEQAGGAYREVVRTGQRRWARRALLKTGMLYETFYRQIAGKLPTTYIGVQLPSPFQVEELDGAALLEPALAPQVAAWPREIARLYEAVREDLERSQDDEKLLAEVKAREESFRLFEALPQERAKNPWLPDLSPGLLRRTHRGFEERTSDGAWRVIEEADARQRAEAALTGGVTDVKSAWALVALSSAGIPVAVTVLEEALASEDERIRLSALVALSEHPRAELYEPLITRWLKLRAPAEERLFPTLQRALFGEKERVVAALRMLADRERDLAGKLADEQRLPPRVRAYLLAELGDNRLLPHHQKLAAVSDRTATAVALYGAYLAAGRRVVYSLRPNDADPVGCVSRHLRAIESQTQQKSSAHSMP